MSSEMTNPDNVGGLPPLSAFKLAVWRDWMTNEQANRLGADLRSWLLAYAALWRASGDVGGLPDLPEKTIIGFSRFGTPIYGHTDDAMRAYGELCRAAHVIERHEGGCMTDPAHAAAIEAVSKCQGMKPEDAREYLEMLGCVAVHFMRARFGDEYTRGWLEHALSDLDQAPMIELRKPQ